MSQRAQASRLTPASQTQTQTTTSVDSSNAESAQPAQRILRLRGRQNNGGRSVQWAEDVVDNEGLGRKSSKVCCIYHKPKAVGESSDESSSSSSDSDTDSEDGADSKRAGRGGRGDSHKGHDCGHDHGDGARGSGRQARRKRPQGSGKEKRQPSPNAYEKIPKVKTREVEGSSK